MVLSRPYLESLACDRFKNDLRYRLGHIHILAPAPGTEIIGMHTPEMKKVAREIVNSEDWRNTLLKFSLHNPIDGAGGLTHEERMIWGLVIDYVKCPLDERLSLVDTFLPSIDNWAICDNFCCNSAWAKKTDKDILWQYIKKLLHSGSQWYIRTGTVLAMCHFLDEDSLDRTFAEIDLLGLQEGEPYYVRMGIAWLLATSLAKNENRTREFVSGSSLPSDIVKLYIRKARESFRTRNVKALNYSF